MEYQIWRQLTNILTHRDDLVNIIKPFFQELKNSNNNEKYNLNEKKHIPFLKILPWYQLDVLHDYKIIDENLYLAVVTMNSSKPLDSMDERVFEIIKGDKVEDLQRLIRIQGHLIPISRPFKEAQKMTIPVIHECVIQKAIKCFKFLLINGIDDPKQSMQDRKLDPKNYYWDREYNFQWDCMALAIYYGEMDFVKMLEEIGIEIGDDTYHIEAAILSYRNAIVKKIISNLNGKKGWLINKTLYNGLIASTKNNNIKGAELLINNGAKINVEQN